MRGKHVRPVWKRWLPAGPEHRAQHVQARQRTLALERGEGRRPLPRRVQARLAAVKVNSMKKLKFAPMIS